MVERNILLQLVSVIESLMHTLLATFLFLLLWSSNVNAEVNCPNACECNETGITCTNLNRTEFDQILSGLSNDLINRFTVRKCSSALGRIEALPSNFHTRSLEISSCSVSAFGSDAFKFLSNDLVELRLANNSLTSMPFLQKLNKLEVLNLNNNSVSFSQKKLKLITSILVRHRSGRQFQRHGKIDSIALEEQQNLQIAIVSQKK